MNAAAAVTTMRYPWPLLAPLVYRFDVGGLENGIANLIDRLRLAHRHAIAGLTEIAEFGTRILVRITIFHPGNGPGHGMQPFRLERMIDDYHMFDDGLVSRRNALRSRVGAGG